MSDARWLDVADDIAEATDHFVKAHALYGIGRFDDQGLDGYRDRMALMHALESAHTSAKKALLRILSVLGEEKPSGEDWHQKLISRLAKAIDDDPPLAQPRRALPRDIRCRASVAVRSCRATLGRHSRARHRTFSQGCRSVTSDRDDIRRRDSRAAGLEGQQQPLGSLRMIGSRTWMEDPLPTLNRP